MVVNRPPPVPRNVSSVTWVHGRPSPGAGFHPSPACAGTAGAADAAGMRQAPSTTLMERGLAWARRAARRPDPQPLRLGLGLRIGPAWPRRLARGGRWRPGADLGLRRP